MDLENKIDISEEIIIEGVGSSPGICIGHAYIVYRKSIDVIKKYFLQNDNEIKDEVNRFKNAVNKVENEYNAILKSVSKEFREEFFIIEAHKILLKDKQLYGKTLDVIESKKVNAEWALRTVLQNIKSAFNKMTDTYLKERVSDIVHVTDKIMSYLIGADPEEIFDIDKRVILIANDLSPAETAKLQLKRIQGFLTNHGGKNSHTSIIARALEVPAVIGLNNATEIINNDDIIIVDGTTGIVIINPTDESLIRYEERKVLLKDQHDASLKEARLPSITSDGIEVKVMGNIEIIDEVDSVINHGGDGIGLYRTEFLYMNLKELPSEEQLFNNYYEIVKSMKSKPVTIRTLDINGDKVAASISMPEEANPVLGLRAIRYCLKRPEVFKSQLRAILRASIFGNVRIMFPLISGLDELLNAKEALKKCAKELDQQGIEYDKNMKVGMMMEVPSSIITADILADHVDFFSIGTNDLIQYTLAIDRGNKDVAHLFQPLHPAIIRMVYNVCQAAHKKGIEVYICGEMAADPFHTPILLALEVDELSMNAQSIPAVKSIIRKVKTDNFSIFADELLKQKTHNDIIKLVQKEYGDIFCVTI